MAFKEKQSQLNLVSFSFTTVLPALAGWGHSPVKQNTSTYDSPDYAGTREQPRDCVKENSSTCGLVLGAHVVTALVEAVAAK